MIVNYLFYWEFVLYRIVIFFLFDLQLTSFRLNRLWTLSYSSCHSIIKLNRLVWLVLILVKATLLVVKRPIRTNFEEWKGAVVVFREIFNRNRNNTTAEAFANIFMSKIEKGYYRREQN